MKPYLLNAIPEELWVALREDASSRETPERYESGWKAKRTERTGTSLNNVVCEILARRYSLPFTSSTRPTFDQRSPRRSLYLRIPNEVFDEVRGEAGDNSVRAVILRALANHYDLDVSLAVRSHSKHGRPRGRKAKHG